MSNFSEAQRAALASIFSGVEASVATRHPDKAARRLPSGLVVTADCPTGRRASGVAAITFTVTTAGGKAADLPEVPEAYKALPQKEAMRLYTADVEAARAAAEAAIREAFPELAELPAVFRVGRATVAREPAASLVSSMPKPLPPPAVSSFESAGYVDDQLRALGTDLWARKGGSGGKAERAGQLRVRFKDLPDDLRDLVEATTLLTNGEWWRFGPAAGDSDAPDPSNTVEDLREVVGPLDASGDEIVFHPTLRDYARASQLLRQMARAPLEVAIPLYRGLRLEGAPEPGDEIDLGPVASWTASRDVADDFAQDVDWQKDRRQGDTPVVLVLSDPQRGTDIAPVSAWADEAEVITGGVVRVVEVREDAGVWIAHVEQLPLRSERQSAWKGNELPGYVEWVFRNEMNYPVANLRYAPDGVWRLLAFSDYGESKEETASGDDFEADLPRIQGALKTLGVPPPPLGSHTTRQERSDRSERFRRLVEKQRREQQHISPREFPALLAPPGQSYVKIGQERIEENGGGDGISHYSGDRDYGGYQGMWHRFVYFTDGKPVSGLLLRARRPRGGQQSATIDEVYTAPNARRQGYAAALLSAARAYFRKVQHSRDLTDAGRAWKRRVGAVHVEQLPLDGATRTAQHDDEAAALRAEVTRVVEDWRARYLAAGGDTENGARIPDENGRSYVLQTAWPQVERGMRYVQKRENLTDAEFLREWLENARTNVEPLLRRFERGTEQRHEENAQAAREEAFNARGTEIESLEELPEAGQVWAWHGTSDVFRDEIVKHGIRSQSETGLASNYANVTEGVFLSLRPDVNFYAKKAAYTHGGSPMTVRVLVDVADLQPDPDDADISPGRWQVMTDRVAPTQIAQIDGEWLPNFMEQHRTAQVQQLTLFHGTHLHRLPGVLETGLARNRPTPQEMFGVYLTPDFSTAARYGISLVGRDQVPAVVEVSISSNRRIRKMVWDPKDRRETARPGWEEDYEAQEEVYNESAGVVGDVLNSAAKTLRVRLDHSDYELPGVSHKVGGIVEDIEKLDGFNVAQRAITRLLARSQEQGLPWTRSEVAQAVSTALSQVRAGGYVELKDGVLKLDESWYRTREQLILPQEVPTSAIKGVWLRVSDFPQAPFTATATQRTKELPHETADRLEGLISLAQDFIKLRWESGPPPEEWLRDRLEDVRKLAPNDDEIVGEIELYLDGEPIDPDFWEDAENGWLLAQDDLDEFGIISEDEWGRLDPQQALQLTGAANPTNRTAQANPQAYVGDEYQVRQEDGKAWVQHVGGGYQREIPLESVQTVATDLMGQPPDLPPDSGNEAVDSVLRGEGSFLGRGNDALVWSVGDSVVKLMSTVPFQPVNPGYRTPQEAQERGKAQKELMDRVNAVAGAHLFPESDLVLHAGRAFLVQPRLEIPEKWTKEDLDRAQQALEKLHKSGHALHDEFQVGLTADGQPQFFDPGGVGPLGKYSQEDDWASLRRLYKTHDVPYENSDAELLKDWEGLRQYVLLFATKLRKPIKDSVKTSHNDALIEAALVRNLPDAYEVSDYYHFGPWEDEPARQASFKYHLSLRPPGPGAVPKGYTQSELFSPPRKDLPGVHRSHGWVEYESPLSAEDVERFDLIPEPTEDQLSNAALLEQAADMLAQAGLPFVGRLFRVVAETGRFDKLADVIDQALEDVSDTEDALKEDGHDPDAIREVVDKTRALLPQGKTSRTAQAQVPPEPDGEWLYHITYARNMESIAEQGLFVGGERSTFGGYGGHSKGKIFLTEAPGAPHWQHKIEYAQGGVEGRGDVPVLLRVFSDGLESLHYDEIGSQDVLENAWYTVHPISPSDLEFWGGNGWHELTDWEEDAIESTYEVEVDSDEDDEGNPEEYEILNTHSWDPDEFHNHGENEEDDSAPRTAQRAEQIDEWPLLRLAAQADIKKYLNTGSFFMMSGLNKVGINPSFNHGTLLGIHCYPVDEDHVRRLERGTLKFGDRPYILVVRPKASATILYTSGNWTPEGAQEAAAQAVRPEKQAAWNKMVRVWVTKTRSQLLGLRGAPIFDRIRQALDSLREELLLAASLQQADRAWSTFLFQISDAEDGLEEGSPEARFLRELFDHNQITEVFPAKALPFLADSIGDADSPFRTTSVGRLLAEIYASNLSNAKRSHQLRRLGVDGIVDDAGLNLINSASELANQAVFFSADAIDHLETIYNTRRPRPARERPNRSAQALLAFADLPVGAQFVPLSGERKGPARKTSETSYMMLGKSFEAEPGMRVMRIGGAVETGRKAQFSGGSGSAVESFGPMRLLETRHRNLWDAAVSRGVVADWDAFAPDEPGRRESAARRASDLPRGSRLIVLWDGGGFRPDKLLNGVDSDEMSGTLILATPDRDVLGSISFFSGEEDEPIEINVSIARQGFGPLMYDALLELASKAGRSVVPSTLLSDASAKVWKFYHDQRNDVQKQRLSRQRELPEHVNYTPASSRGLFHVPEEQLRQDADHPAFQHAYGKEDPSTITQLRLAEKPMPRPMMGFDRYVSDKLLDPDSLGLEDSPLHNVDVSDIFPEQGGLNEAPVLAPEPMPASELGTALDPTVLSSGTELPVDPLGADLPLAASGGPNDPDDHNEVLGWLDDSNQPASKPSRQAARDPQDSQRYGSGVLFYCPETGEVLLIKRAEGKTDPGAWADPGGHYRDPTTG